jgi:hypothetical protein
MRERRGLSRLQIICIILLWVLLCIILFIIPSDKSIAEKAIYAGISGILIYVGVSAGQKKMRDRNRRR